VEVGVGIMRKKIVVDFPASEETGQIKMRFRGKEGDQEKAGYVQVDN